MGVLLGRGRDGQCHAQSEESSPKWPVWLQFQGLWRAREELCNCGVFDGQLTEGFPSPWKGWGFTLGTAGSY